MMVVGTDGYNLSVLGPYLADGKNNDSAILNSIIQGNVEEIKNWLEKDDLLVVDRGFRDSIDYLEKIGLNTRCPTICLVDVSNTPLKKLITLDV